MLKKGIVQIYTGDGKGKTTASFGLALRAAGQGNKVLVYQFLKPPGLDLGERRAIETAALAITVEALDVPWEMFESLKDPQAVARAAEAIRPACRRLAQIVHEKQYDVVILDEIVFCMSEGLAKFEDVKAIIDQKNPAVELVLTGRGATPQLIELADLVSEIKSIKHPYLSGLKARAGIEY